MDAGDLILQALMSILIGAMVYLWFLSCILPHGQSIFEIQQKLDAANEQLYESEQLTPP